MAIAFVCYHICYVTAGRDCLNTLQDDISQQNPDGLWAPAWKDEHWAKPLGRVLCFLPFRYFPEVRLFSPSPFF